MNAASKGGTSALIVRSCNCISRWMVPRCENQRSFLSGLNVVNSRAYASWILHVVRCVGQVGEHDNVLA